ncbi:MAG: metallophosphoesterase family protein [Verrucomicrobiales bacterium]|nr:metallophosphoesterase family protein [Verrucomicrobiales bacterium]
MDRRAWTRRALFAAPFLALLQGFALEPRWLRRRHLRLSPRPTCTFAFFTDLHFKGNPGLLDRVIDQIHEQRPDFAVFGGDLVEEAQHLDEVLTRFRTLRLPVYGIPGNHDYWSGIDFDRVQDAFRATGGGWLLDQTVDAGSGRVLLAGHSCQNNVTLDPGPAGQRPRVALVHYPGWADRLSGQWDLILAGHSHGGQVRLPFIGSLITPQGVGRYDLGHFSTKAGPLYVSSGLGTWWIPVRFCCPPEWVLIEI